MPGETSPLWPRVFAQLAEAYGHLAIAERLASPWTHDIKDIREQLDRVLGRITASMANGPRQVVASLTEGPR